MCTVGRLPEVFVSALCTRSAVVKDICGPPLRRVPTPWTEARGARRSGPGRAAVPSSQASSTGRSGDSATPVLFRPPSPDRSAESRDVVSHHGRIGLRVRASCSPGHPLQDVSEVDGRAVVQMGPRDDPSLRDPPARARLPKLERERFYRPDAESKRGRQRTSRGPTRTWHMHGQPRRPPTIQHARPNTRAPAAARPSASMRYESLRSRVGWNCGRSEGEGQPPTAHADPVAHHCRSAGDVHTAALTVERETVPQRGYHTKPRSGSRPLARRERMKTHTRGMASSSGSSDHAAGGRDPEMAGDR
ncbi:hypothetical protein HRbin39_00397 [bacterium HR39]|nr:hypothetical protein HRbin39_00397 [bacterium HR39]